jgi:hypothetical protein
MHDLKFEGTKARKVSVSAEQADAIRYKARLHFGWYSMRSRRHSSLSARCVRRTLSANGCRLRSPASRRCHLQGKKWIRGIDWSEIDENLILKHVTSKKQKETEVDLKLAPMVLEEFRESWRPTASRHGP